MQWYATHKKEEEEEKKIGFSEPPFAPHFPSKNMIRKDLWQERKEKDERISNQVGVETLSRFLLASKWTAVGL